VVEPAVGAEPAAVLDVPAAAAADVAEAADGLLELLLHALALTAMTAEHRIAAAVLLRVENMISSLIRGCPGPASWCC
jgi:hypothetical protein